MEQWLPCPCAPPLPPHALSAERLWSPPWPACEMASRTVSADVINTSTPARLNEERARFPIPRPRLVHPHARVNLRIPSKKLRYQFARGLGSRRCARWVGRLAMAWARVTKGPWRLYLRRYGCSAIKRDWVTRTDEPICCCFVLLPLLDSNKMVFRPCAWN